MKYSVETVIEFIIGLLFALMFSCLTIVVQPFHWLGDLIIRLGGIGIMFLLGFAVGLNKRKDGADNE